MDQSENQNWKNKILANKKIFIWSAIFLFFLIFLASETLYLYPRDSKSDNDLSKTDLLASVSSQEPAYRTGRPASFPNLDASTSVKDSNNARNDAGDSSIGISAKSFAVMDLNTNKFLYQRNYEEKMPIASLTKLMAAIVTLENFNMDDSVTISKEAEAIDGAKANFAVGEQVSIRSLFYAALISSSNDAVMSIAENTPDNFVLKIFNSLSTDPSAKRDQKIKAFLALMNKKAQELNLNSTYFADPAGLSPETQSSASDLSKVSSYIFKNYPVIFETTKIPTMGIFSIDGAYSHKLVSTDKLLETMDGLIVGGKTGYIDEAGQCLLVVFRKGSEVLSAVILNSPDRFKEMKALIDWASHNNPK